METKLYREIQSQLKSKRILNRESESPLKWPFMKILREQSNTKMTFDCNPYAEVYKFRENVYGIFTESLDGMGDPWMYLIDGPKKAMLVDTGFGCGDLKGLIHEIVGDKECIVVNTHSHYDHAYGNAQFDKVYCHENEVFRMKRTQNPHIWDYLFDENGKCIWTEFDRNDLVKYKDYEIVPIPDNYIFDLGDGYEVEAMLIPGHTPGQCGYLDKHNHILFSGDTSHFGMQMEDEPNTHYCSVNEYVKSLRKIVARIDEIEGVFPGHGAVDQTNTVLKNWLEAAEEVLADPESYDYKREVERNGQLFIQYGKKIYQGSQLTYTMQHILKEESK